MGVPVHIDDEHLSAIAGTSGTSGNSVGGQIKIERGDIHAKETA
jgi:hypothetical protein